MRTVKQKIPAKVAVYTLRVQRDKLDRMHEIADAEYRTLTQKLRSMIDEEIARHDEPRAAA